ncbi:putative polycystic kidney disease protein 1-like 2 [Scophthalmus maximus]|uniref:Putative polycystic kidney disease protein 1-like 2 n=1 Tax=Scophthalmus maximus TaxID=52904 RepID=A0A2U9C8B3_SCOMX|nr:putative polycystic kidney disease protein 1-like 2 [Scophthalmus maximus]
MCWSVQQLLILVTLGRLSCGGDEAELSVSCPGHQRASEGSRYEFVAQERSFSGAQACCEERGGHLAFVPNKDTQHFLQRHLDPEKDVWLGVALSASPNLQYSATVGGALFWLDGSNVTYSNWASSPEPGAACGHILKDSGFQWEATRDCDKKLCFICQFESRRKVVCAGRDNTLRCGSGQVLMIDGGFYGRKNAHYCRPTTSSPTTSAQRHCGWVDVEESLRALCHGRQFCQIAELVTSAGEPCPQLGSYLSVDYQCKDGLTLSASTVAAVLTDITIDIKWLLHLTSGKPVCRLSTGDGHVIYLDSPEGLESSVVHKYKSPSTFVMAVECTSGDVHVTVQKIITISEPVTDISVTGCYAAAQSFHATNCKALHGGAFHIEMELKAGSNVTYRAQRDEMVLSGSSAERGNIPRNITVTAEMVKQLGPGCHQLTIFASNPVTIPEVSTDLQVCVLENVVGLWASVLMERDECGRSPHITVGVSLEKGAPVLLLFSLTGGDNDSFYESREMNARKGIFHIGHPIHGTAQVKLRARNVFSSLEVDVDMFDSCGKDSIIKPNEHNNHGLSLNTSLRTKHNRVTRSADKIQAKPSNSVTTKQSIQLSVLDASKLNKPDERYQWECKNPCKCAGNFENLVHTITTSCLPEPLEFFKYHFKVIKKKNNDVKKKESICITFTPRVYQPLTISFTCTQGCDPVKVNTDAKIKMVCIMCPQVVWNIEDPRDHNHWPAETKSCYEKSKKRPLIEKQNGGNEYTVKHSHLALAKSEGQDVTVVAIRATATIPGTITTTTATTRATTSPANTTNVESLLCSISPLDGTVLDAFNITCEIKIPCCTCLYCFKSEGRHLLCSKNNKVTSVFLPLGDNQSNYNLIITATAKNDSFVVGTNITTQVMDSTGPSGSSVSGLKSSVEKAVAQLKDQGLLSGETVGQIFSSVANKLNGQSDASQKADRQKLRERMLDILTRAVDVVPANTPEEVQVIARSLTAVSVKGTELSSSAQEKVALLFVDLSSSLLRMDVPQNEENKKAMYSAASNIVEGVSNILGYTLNKNISDALLVVLKNTQSALLILKDANEGPTIIQQANIGVLVNRVNLGSLHTLNPIRFPNNNCPRFSLPKLPSNIFTLEEPADIRMLCVDKNPFSWNEKGNISGKIVALSLTTKDGATIRLENLSEDIEILFPRPVGERGNASVLDLGNYSTMVIDVPSTDTTLVLKMAPSKDPLPFKVFLGYMSYPTEANHVAMTEMPQQGTTQEQRYTWLVDPKNFRGKTGVHYLVVRPIVGPGIKSINASLLVTSISAACKFWNESLLEWSNRGCRVGVQTTHSVTQCLCNHLTFFGSSFFVTPNLVDPSRSAELFATFAENPVVVCFVGALFVAYLLVVVWARRKDIKDTAKVRVTVLEDNDPIDEYRYLLSVSTGHRRGASTSSQVTLTLLGADGNSEPHHLADPKKRLFESGAVDMFLLTTPFSLGDLQSLRLWHNNTGSHPAWYVGHVTVQDVQTNQKWHFLCNSWLAIDVGNCCLDQVFPVSSEMDLKSFSNLFFMKTTKDLRDGHLWYSVISRPPSSTFTCVQRVSCCFSLLLCTMLTSIMFYGIPTDPSEQTMDLGHFEFTWQQFMVGVQSSLVMFPVNILIVSIFRHTRPRETSCCKRRQEKPCPQTPSSQTASNDKKVNVTLDLIIKDITRIAHSLFLSAKSNIPFTESTEFGPGQQHDINAVLSAVDDFVRRNYKTGDGADRVQSQPSDAVSSASVHPATDVEGVQKSNKVQYLYRQLCHIDKELSLLGSSGFPSAHSYSQALQQVQGIKGFLEDQLLKPSGANVDGLPQKKSSLAGSTGGGGDRKKSGCCRGGLPWWFIFVGWLLVIATSSVAGYFTMIYGLKFGKERSISWLVSMIVSFFQSILVIQPLKVLCLAAFFALVIKKVDEEDFQNVTFDSNAGDCKDQQTVREDRNLYEPPPPADVDRMKRNKIMEQKAFALLREIFIYTGFMWMLLLVAHGQRDPNAFFLHQHIRKSFGGGLSRSMSLGDVFAWANTSLLSNLFGAYPGFITDGNSRLVGNARLRQLRVQRSSCQIAGSMLQLVSDCHAPYSREVEDTGSYDSGWNQSLGGNATMSTSGPWTYQAQARLRARPLWGKMVVYRGGGFVAELGPDLKNASRTIEYLFRNKWLDVYTRAFIVEFTIYNANVNLFGIVTLLLETTAVGAFQLHSELQSVRLYQSTGSLHIFVMAAEVTYVLFIIYYMFLQGKLMKQQGGAYFRSKWNLLELSIIILSWSAVAVFITRTLIGNRDMTYYQNHRDQFVSFHETAAADSVLSYLIAFVLMLATVKLWHLLRLNPKMNMLTATLQRAWGDISSFLVVIGIMLVAYSTACNVIYGWKISSYRTFADALLTIISLQIGIFNYSEVLDYTPLLGGLLIGSCIVFMTFVVLNLLISVILVAFKQEQTDHKPSEEKEIVDLMLKKIYSFFGIRYDDKKDPRGPDTTGSSGPTLNTSRNLLS